MRTPTPNDAPGLDELESEHPSSVRRHDILDARSRGTFDRIAALVARSFGAAIAIVRVGDGDGIWFEAHHGVVGVEHHSVDLCALSDPLVAGGLGLHFYAGVPLTTSDGSHLGMLCVLDREPRELSADDLAHLAEFAALVTDAVELRLAARRTVQQETELRQRAEGLAAALQASLLPPTPPALPGMELATRYRPGERGLDVGGDFYDVFRLAANDWGVVVGDVCGKGARAAAVTALARWTLRAAAVHSFRPATVLGELNAALLADGGPDVDDHFCSAVFARIELDACGAWVTLASAGHPRPVVVRRAGWIDVRGHVGLPLGMFDDAATDDDRVGLGPGDAMVVFTDGITEARDAEGRLFGDEALPEVLLECCGVAAEEAAERLVASATAFAGGALRDDAAVLVVRVPDDAMVDPVGRITQATGQPAERLELPGYPLGDVQPDLWRRPPDPPREARIRLPPEAASVPALRGLLGRLLHSWRLDDLARSGDVALLATEVATNAIRHAGTPLTVLVCYLGPALRVEVGDSSPVVPVARPAPPEELGGRGLLILEALARDWGVIRTRTGKRVWFEVDVTKDVPSAGGDQRRRT